MSTGREARQFTEIGVEASHPFGSEAAVHLRERLEGTTHVNQRGVGSVGVVDGGARLGEPVAQTAHSESPTAATNGPCSP